MKFTILGSGGAVRIPKACCSCNVCEEARLKGGPYKRLGQSLYLNEGAVLFDTPEDIQEALNTQRIPSVHHIAYSHWHPDHTLGARIIESLAFLSQRSAGPKLQVSLPQTGLDISINGNGIFDFYESEGYCTCHSEKAFQAGSVTVTRRALNNGFAEAFVLAEGDKRVLYCPCHVMHLPVFEDLIGCDLLILCKGEVGELSEDWSHFERDTLKLVEAYQAKRCVLTHIEETDGLGYDDYAKLEKSLKHLNLKFAYDGMTIEL